MAKAANHNYIFEFDEDSFNQTSFEPGKKIAIPGSFRSSKKRVDRKTPSVSPGDVRCVSSLPVSVPDWSKIYRGGSFGGVLDYDQESDDDHGEGDRGRGDQESRVPPHEYLARRRGASFSVHEGIGRTLKGRDLRQVRNAIWEKVGFED
ncbi:hypothetical protein M5689_015841 [Euphorbia peplus]|nr:hypothetical protein M5689_015841 [Euphorbia peplus]